MVGYTLNVYAPALFAIKKSPNITNGARHLFNMITLARDFFKNKAEFYDYCNTIHNNIYHLCLEPVTLALLTDDRKEKRKLGRKIILKARLDKRKIKGVRYFTQLESVNDVNYDATDYSDFLKYEKLKYYTEPPVTIL